MPQEIEHGIAGTAGALGDMKHAPIWKSRAGSRGSHRTRRAHRRARVTAKRRCNGIASSTWSSKKARAPQVLVRSTPPDAGEGVIGLSPAYLPMQNARVNVATIHTLGQGWLALDGEGYIACEDARIQVDHRVLGAGQSFVALVATCRASRSDATIRTRYLGHGDERRDFTPRLRHRGEKPHATSTPRAFLTDECTKILRGTIDLVHGCAGAEGTERETVLLADEKVVNKTIPTILCDEDDVAGNHGATIGHVRPEQMNYLMTRGISQEAAERLFANATFEDAAITTPMPTRARRLRNSQN